MIGVKTRNTIRDAVGALLNMHGEELDRAYLKSEKSLSLSIAVTLKPEADGEGVAINTSLAFVTNRVKDNLTSTIRETWEELPGMTDAK